METSAAPSSIAGNSTERGPHSAETSFAELLSSMAAPPKPEITWNDSALAEDVATISYEQALRTHTRSHGTACNGWSEHEPGATSSGSSIAHSPDCERESPAAKPSRTASITIRLSEAECAQLRQRAGESGLTVSSYLRSCILEVESLRAQVKDTLAQLRAPKPAAPECDPYDHVDAPGGFPKLLACLSRRFRQVIPRRHRSSFRLNPGNPFAPVQ